MSKRQKVEAEDIRRSLQQRKENICRRRETKSIFENSLIDNERFREAKVKTFRKIKKIFSADVEKLITRKSMKVFS